MIARGNAPRAIPYSEVVTATKEDPESQKLRKYLKSNGNARSKIRDDLFLMQKIIQNKILELNIAFYRIRQIN